MIVNKIHIGLVVNTITLGLQDNGLRNMSVWNNIIQRTNTPSLINGITKTKMYNQYTCTVNPALKTTCLH